MSVPGRTMPGCQAESSARSKNTAEAACCPLAPSTPWMASSVIAADNPMPAGPKPMPTTGALSCEVAVISRIGSDQQHVRPVGVAVLLGAVLGHPHQQPTGCRDELGGRVQRRHQAHHVVTTAAEFDDQAV